MEQDWVMVGKSKKHHKSSEGTRSKGSNASQHPAALNVVNNETSVPLKPIKLSLNASDHTVVEGAGDDDVTSNPIRDREEEGHARIHASGRCSPSPDPLAMTLPIKPHEANGESSEESLRPEPEGAESEPSPQSGHLPSTSPSLSGSPSSEPPPPAIAPAIRQEGASGAVNEGTPGTTEKKVKHKSGLNFPLHPTSWPPKSLCMGSDKLMTLPNVRFPLQKPPSSASHLKQAALKYFLITNVSRPWIDQGPRSLQQDSVLVDAIRAQTPLIIICDGHGSISLLDKEPTEVPGDIKNFLHVGGRQAAEICSQTILQFMNKYADEFSLHKADEFFHRAFSSAHSTVLNQIFMGTEKDPDGQPARKDMSALDGTYFSHSLNKWLQLVPRSSAINAVVSKELLLLPDGSQCPFYRRANGSWEHGEFGTTCTACVILNAADEIRPYRKVCVTGNVGDTDACLFRFSSAMAGQRAVLKFGLWLTKEHSLYSREERERPLEAGGVLSDYEGGEGIKFKLKVDIDMPQGGRNAVAYEPTRGIGHAIGQFRGIIPSPSISVVEVEDGDIIVVGTDGLWNALGGRRRPGDTRELGEEMEGVLLANMKKFFQLHREKDPQAIGGELMNLAKRKGLQDNASLAVVKITSSGMMVNT
uniref:PPM-type phosphatase domain-containing protein n=1 Tax=Guillardia theta TaxID=55529 RepID=A0A7S4M1D3_GUITH|mmetsp:Transcript_1362/g.4161  ORF Transcript_1362/g.4161 Transcript_1362/m.4161 type:complete len:644 (+) Transcript_1362:48-1979(+)